MTKQPSPTGFCWCGCGENTSPEKFFVPGHDRRAESRLIRLKWGGIPRFLEKHGYSPNGPHWKEIQRET